MKRRVWMKVSKDKYQLPLAVADTQRELAEMCGVKLSTIQAYISHAQTSEKFRRCPYIRVEWEGGDDEEE